MDKKAAIRAYAIVIMLMISVSGAALAPFLATLSFQQQTSNNDQAPESAIVTCQTGGSYLYVSKTADAWWTETKTYDWSVTKSVDKLSATIDQGSSDSFVYTIDATRTVASDVNKYGVSGTIRVWNDGSLATVGLAISDTIQYKMTGGSWTNLQTTSVSVASKPIIPAYTSCDDNDVGVYSYNIEFTPVAGACAYRNVATATATNLLPGSSNVGSHTFSLPTSSQLTEVDKNAKLVDDLIIPEFYEIVGSAPTSSWSLTGSAEETFTVIVKNVDAPEGVSEMTNTASVIRESDNHVFDSDSATVLLTSGGVLVLPQPHMTIVKTGPSEALPGETVTWVITLTNDGEVQLNDIHVTDTFANTPFNAIVSLSPGGSAFWNVEYTIPSNTEDVSVTNTATASVDLGSQLPYVVAASAIVPIMYPDVEITKTANVEYAVPGTSITYTVRVYNPGNVDLINIKVDDSMKGVITFPNIPAGEYREVSYTVVSSAWNEFVNADDKLCNEVSVTASGESEGGFAWEVSASDELCLFVPIPSIEIVKTTEQKFACVGDQIAYDITVTNTGNTILYDVQVDDVLANVHEDIEELAIGAHEHFTGFYTVLVSDGNNVENTATAVGTVDGFNEWTVNDDDSVTVPVAKPDIQVTKVGSASNAVPGDVITYTVSVKNIGNWDLVGVDMSDSLKGDIASVDIAQGVTWSTTYTYTVPADISELVNTFSATYYVCEQVTKTATWTVKVTQDEDTPMISIEKTGPCRAMIGENLPFNVTVTNTGNVPISDVYVKDLTNGQTYLLDDYDNSLAGFVGDGSLLAGQVWHLPIIWAEVYDNTDLDVYVNIAQVFGMYGELNVWCQDSHAVDLIHPSIVVEKSADKELAFEGDKITYTITVTNTGDVSLYNVVLYDSIWGSNNCNQGDEKIATTATPIYKEIDVGYLGLDATKTFKVEFIVPDGWNFDYVCNGVVAWGQPGQSSLWCGHGICPWFDATNEGRWVSDCDHVCTFIAKPAISVEKTGPCCIDPTIGDMTFKVTIENTGNIMITDLYVWDNATGNYYGLIEGADLDVGEIMTIEISWNLGEYELGDLADDMFVNVVEVRGDVFGDGVRNVWDDGTCSVHVDMPAIFLDKEVIENEGAMPGDEITFTFYIENTGNVPLTDIMLYDDLLGAAFPIAIIDLGVGESTTVSFPYVIPADVSGDLSNIAQVKGYSECSQVEAFAQDEVLYFVADPCIEVSKEAKIDTVLVGEEVHWIITVHNCGNVDLTGVYLDDSLAGDSILVGDLAVDETKEISFDYLVTSDSPWDAKDMLCNEVDAYGYYGELKVTDDASDCVFIAQPSMTVEKTGPEEVCYKDVIEWTVTVTNTGNVPLYNIWVEDVLTGDAKVIIEMLAVDDFVVFKPTYDTSSAALTDPVNNHVDVTADVFGDESNFIYGDASHSVNVAFVDIEVVKTAPEFAVSGETITYGITVYNNGNRDALIYLNDELLGLEDYEIFVEAGDSWSSVERSGFSYTIPCCAGEVLENTVTVETTYNDCCSDSATDTATTNILEMGVRVLKTGPESAVPGETITFRFDVWNSGEVTLSDLVANDITLDVEFDLEGVLVPEGGLGANHAVWTYSYQVPVDYLGSASYGWLDNHVMVYGYFHGVETSWGDGWSVWIHQPDCFEQPK